MYSETDNGGRLNEFLEQTRIGIPAILVCKENLRSDQHFMSYESECEKSL
jgi:hypothetical protein